jgi:hypothetical protein
VGLRRIELRQGTRCLEIELTDLVLTNGFHAHEPENRLRWTDGNTALPTRVLGAFEGPKELALHVGATTFYVILDPAVGPFRRHRSRGDYNPG